MLKNKMTMPKLMNDFFNNRKLFPDVFNLDGDLMDFYGGTAMVPEANIIENEKDFLIELAAPGLERNDFKVKVEDGVLKISAEKKEEKKEEEWNFMRREFSFNSFSRAFTLPENCVPEKIDAKYDNGILHLMLPKKEIKISKPANEIKVM